uniref:PEGA domain-containing protein n=1 Tax=candidate division CPR3 bacterium TaxID=2268181 RepID=A0A7V3N4J5_UNCC3
MRKKFENLSVVAVMAFIFLSSNLKAEGSKEDQERLNHIWRTFHWVYDENEYEMTIAISLQDLIEAKKNINESVERKLKMAEEFFDEGWRKFFREAAEESGENMANVAMSFVQSIPYKTSPIPGLPVQVFLGLGAGDCDDHAIAAVGLLNALGYEAAIWDVVDESHYAVALHVDEEYPGLSVNWEGKRWIYWEAAGPFKLGEVTQNADKSPVRIITAARSDNSKNQNNPPEDEEEDIKSYGSISVVCSVDNVRVFIDGSFVGLCNLGSSSTFDEIEVGSHTVIGKKKGYRPFSVEVNVEVSKVSFVNFNLKKIDVVKKPKKKTIADEFLKNWENSIKKLDLENNATAWKVAGELLLRAIKFEDAKKAFKKYLELAPNAPDAPFYKGVVRGFERFDQLRY